MEMGTSFREHPVEEFEKNVTDGIEETYLFEIFTCTLDPSKSTKDVDSKFSVEHI